MKPFPLQVNRRLLFFLATSLNFGGVAFAGGGVFDSDISKEEIEKIGRWIKQGAMIPDDGEVVTLTTDHWSFQPVATSHRHARVSAYLNEALEVNGSLGLAMDVPEQELRLVLAEGIASKDNLLRPWIAVNRRWPFPPRRHEAEALPDRMLPVAGTLDLTMGGPGFHPFGVDLEDGLYFHAKVVTPTHRRAWQGDSGDFGDRVITIMLFRNL